MIDECLFCFVGIDFFFLRGFYYDWDVVVVFDVFFYFVVESFVLINDNFFIWFYKINKVEFYV